MKQFLPLVLFLSFPAFVSAQHIFGYVQNENNEPVPFVNVYVQELRSGTVTNEEGYYFLNLDVGEYEIVFSAVGYQTQNVPIVIQDEPVEKNLWMKTSSVELNEVVIKAKKRDPAYEIIQKAIENKKKYLKQVESSRSQVYIKAIEELEKSGKEKKPKREVISLEGEPMDPFEAANKEQQALLDKLNMVEMQIQLNYQYPKQYKEERLAYKAYGDKNGLFIPRFGDTDFNFYKNLVVLTGISEAPLISPISRTSILSYKFKLVEAIPENGQLVYKIKITPRKSGNSTCSGFIYINDNLWNINRIDISLPKGGLRFYDEFRLEQSYQQIDSSLWIVNRQAFYYTTKQGKSKKYRGNTLIKYSDFEPNYAFPPKFFGNELAVTTKEAYERDTSYWKAARPEPLTEEEMKMVYIRDSIKAVLNSKTYKDSIQLAYNKITFAELLYDGIGFRNHEKKEDIYIAPLLGLIEFEVIGGFRLGPYVSYFRRFPDEKVLLTNASFNIGTQNGDFQGSTNIFYRYDPIRLGEFNIRAGRSFFSINTFDAYLNQLSSFNYILNDRIDIYHQIELFNGFYVRVRGDYSDRRSIDQNFDSKTFISNWINDDSEPPAFENYQSLITEFQLIMIPGQRYMTEPNRKVLLGSKYPTIALKYKKGWNGALSSDIDFDYIEMLVEQDILFGTFGNSKYNAKVGKFTNTRDLRFVDVRRFRQSDPYLYSDPLNSFQLLDTSLIARDWFFEFHLIHHFNGALINNVPLVKKLRVRVVAGGGVLWIRESNYRHEEIFVGLERVFKIGKRRRLRIGTYGVLADSNKTGVNTGFKISFDLIDTWKKNWSY